MQRLATHWIGLLVLVGPALARAGEGYDAPELESSFSLKALGATLAVAFGMALCVLKDSKRQHQEES
jgi:hypothetical protein